MRRRWGREAGCDAARRGCNAAKRLGTARGAHCAGKVDDVDGYYPERRALPVGESTAHWLYYSGGIARSAHCAGGYYPWRCEGTTLLLYYSLGTAQRMHCICGYYPFGWTAVGGEGTALMEDGIGSRERSLLDAARRSGVCGRGAAGPLVLNR